MNNPDNAKRRGWTPAAAINISRPSAPDARKSSVPDAVPAPRRAPDSGDGPMQLPLVLEGTEQHADPAWWPTMMSAITAMAATTDGPWTVDDLRDRHPEIGEPPHGRWWGLVFSAAAKAGIIRATGYVATSRRRTRAAGYARLWTGTDLVLADTGRRAA